MRFENQAIPDSAKASVDSVLSKQQNLVAADDLLPI